MPIRCFARAFRVAINVGLMAVVPRVVVILCGKRKSGKDFVASKLHEM